MTNVGYRIKKSFDRSSRDLVSYFSKIPVSNIADNMNRSFCVRSDIRRYNNAPLAGLAFTVKTRPGDNLFLNKAIDLAKPGDVIVVDAQGDTTNSLMGELMAFWSKNRGISGFVIDGAIRDVEDISKMSMPVYAAGVTPAGPYKDGPGEINFPVSCGGVTVNPGDIIIGDADGVVVINSEEASEILKGAQKTMKKEKEVMEKIKGGTWDREWIDQKLKEKGCEFIE
jgi:RraA family protein